MRVDSEPTSPCIPQGKPTCGTNKESPTIHSSSYHMLLKKCSRCAVTTYIPHMPGLNWQYVPPVHVLVTVDYCHQPFALSLAFRSLKFLFPGMLSNSSSGQSDKASKGLKDTNISLCHPDSENNITEEEDPNCNLQFPYF